MNLQSTISKNDLFFKRGLSYFILCCCLVLSGSVWGQTVVLSEDFGTSCGLPAGWSDTGADPFVYSAPNYSALTDHTTGTDCFAAHDDSSDDGNGELVSPSMDLSSASGATLTFWYVNNAQATNSQSNLRVDISTNNGTSFTNDVGVYNTSYTSWTEITLNIPASFFSSQTVLRFRTVESNSFYSDVSIDDIEVSALLCIAPIATFVPSANCPTDFSIDVNVTTNDATGVDISDNDASTAYSFTNAQDGIVTMGPYTVGTDVEITVAGIGCTTTINSGTLTEACACTNVPTATVTSLAPDCGAGTFDIEVTIDSDGDGDVNMSDIYVNGLVEMTNVTTGSTVTINKPVTSYNVTIVAEGAGFVTCESVEYPASASCTNLTCETAFNVLTDGTIVSTTGLPNSSSTYIGSSCDGSGNEENWFSFTSPSSGVVLLDVTNYSASFQTVVYAVYSGTCGGLTEVTCGSVSGGSAPTILWGNQLISGLTGGEVYYLEISTGSGSGQTFDVALTSPISDITAGTSNCWDLSTASTLFDLGDSGDDYDCGFSSAFSGSTDDQVAFVYTPSMNETVDLIIDNVIDNEGSDFAVAIFDNTVGTPVVCLDGLTTSTDATISGVNLTGGTSYIIIIGGQTSIHDATGCLTIQAQCGTIFTNLLANDCGAATFNRTLNFSDLGLGTNIVLDDGEGTTYGMPTAGIAISTDYIFSYTDLSDHTVTVNGYDSGGVFVCSETVTLTSGCNGSDDFSLTAPNILGTCMPGNLTIATAGLAQGFTGGCHDNLGVSGSTGNNVIRDCSAANFDNNTNWVDLWYQVDLPDGTDEMTLEITGLNAGEIVGFHLHTGDPGTNASNTQVFSGNSDDCSFFDNTITSHTITGLAGASTAPIYIRILSIAFDDGAGCGSIIDPTFTICATAPQPNDVCNDAINVTTNNLINTGVVSTGDLTLAADEGNSIDCTGASITGNDLWYEVLYPDVPSVIQTFFTELSLTGNAGDQYIINVFDVTSACGSAGDPADMDHCELITLTGGTDVTTLGDITSTDGQSREVQIIGVNVTGPVTVEANVVYENNTCSHFQNVLPGYDITNAQPVDFNYSTDSGAIPATAGSDLWFQFSPLSNNDGYGLYYSTSADVTISGLNTSAGEELTFILYQGNGLSADNCIDLAGDFLSSTTLSSNNTFPQAISCLDGTHGSTDGGYLIRIVQSAGTTTANPTITITSGPAGPSNNDCTNIWNGNGAKIGPADNPQSDAAHDWNQFLIFDGETVSGTFVGTNDCDYDATCNGVDYEAIQEINDRDAWYVFEVPDNECATLGLTQSTVLYGMDITYDAGDAFHDAIMYVYSDCGDGNLIDCSGALDGAGTTWTVEGLAQGQSYLLRVKPWDISSTPTDWTFDITVDNGNPAPCNDKIENAEALAVNTGCATSPWYPSLETFSALGARDEETFGQDDVFFQFTAPLPANGGAYTPQVNANYPGLEKSWVTIFLESVSGHNITMELWNEQQVVATANDFSVSGTGDKIWARFGHLEPGATYQIRLRHGETLTTDVQYKIRIEAGDIDNTVTVCDANNITATPILCGSCGGENSTPYIADPAVSSLNSNSSNNHCEAWYKIDLPESAGGAGTFWVVEVRGEEQVLDFELRSQYISESGVTHGGQDDFDHPCSSRPLESAASLVSSIPVTYEVDPGPVYNGDATTPSPYLNAMGGTASACQCVTGCSAEEATSRGGGYRKVYSALNGPASGTKDYYYIRVFMDEDDPAYTACHDGGVLIDPCQVIFRGPYSSDPTLDAGGNNVVVPGAPDLDCLLTCNADAGDIANDHSAPGALNVCEGSDLFDTDGTTEIIFSTDYTAGDETDPTSTGYQYAFLVADASGNIMLTSTDGTGNLDFSTLTAGTYTVYSLSYATSNSESTVAAYLAALTNNTIAEIQGDDDDTSSGGAGTGNYCLDLDSGALSGHTTMVTVAPCVDCQPEVGISRQ